MPFANRRTCYTGQQGAVSLCPVYPAVYEGDLPTINSRFSYVVSTGAVATYE